MSTGGRVDIESFARVRLGIELMPWQVEVLNRAVNSTHERTYISHPRGYGRKAGIRTLNVVLDELRDAALWLTPEFQLSEVYRVAAKYLP